MRGKRCVSFKGWSMRRLSWFRLLWVFVLIGLVGWSCTGQAEQVSPTPLMMPAVASPSETLTPTSSPTPEPVSTPTFAPTPKPLTINPESHIIRVNGYKNDGGSVVASVGDTIEITLYTVGPGKYGDTIVSSGSVEFLEMSFVTPYNPGGPVQCYRFKAITSGQVDIRIPFTNGWPDAVFPVFTITVIVQ